MGAGEPELARARVESSRSPAPTRPFGSELSEQAKAAVGARVKAWRHREGGFEKCFCRECGAHLFSRNPDDPTQMSVRMGAFDGDPGVRPSWRTYVAYAAAWEPIPDDGLERFAEGKPRV